MRPIDETIEDIRQQAQFYQGKKINSCFLQDGDALVLKTDYLLRILDAINQLPVWKQEIETMSVFASAVTQDPHFFDKGIENTLLFQGICYFLNVEEQDISLAEKNKLYYEAGLLKDDLSNSCMIAHLNAEGRDGKVHEAWKGFFDRYEAWTVSLYNLQQIHNISDAIKAVYIVENPSVFRSLFLEYQYSSRFRCLSITGGLY